MMGHRRAHFGSEQVTYLITRLDTRRSACSVCAEFTLGSFTPRFLSPFLCCGGNKLLFAVNQTQTDKDSAHDCCEGYIDNIQYIC